MKKKVLSLILSAIFLSCFAFSSCEQLPFAPSQPKNIVHTFINEDGELIITYSDDTTENLGVVKGEDGTDGKDLTACEHIYDDWETTVAATCTSMGYDMRTCTLCGHLDYQFMEATGHDYDYHKTSAPSCSTVTYKLTTCGKCGLENYELSRPQGHDFEEATDLVNNCNEHLQIHTCLKCDEIEIIEAPIEHDYDENGICLECGYETHFIENEEYIEDYMYENLIPTKLWWSKDRTYGLIIGWKDLNGEEIDRLDGYTIFDYVGTPVDVILPISFDGEFLYSVGIEYLSDYPIIGPGFQDCTTLKSIIIQKGVIYLDDYAFQGCTSLEYISMPNSLNVISQSTFENCISLKSITLPKGVDQLLGSDMFKGCTSLEEVIILNTNPALYKFDFEGLPLKRIYLSKNATKLDQDSFLEAFPNLEFIYFD